MKITKTLFLFIFLITISLNSCDNLITDMPDTNTTKYVSGNTVTFPVGTKAVDVYNTVSSIIIADDWKDVNNANWKYVKTDNNKDGSGITQKWASVSFTKIRHSYKSSSDVHTYTVYLLNTNDTTKEIIFQWQRQTTNVWQNEPIEGEITFSF